VTAVTTVGLDPWKGLHHVERPGRPALALDLIEPYRPILADSTVLMALNNGELATDDFVFAAGGWVEPPVVAAPVSGGAGAENAAESLAALAADTMSCARNSVVMS